MDKDIKVSRAMMGAEGFMYAAKCLRDSIYANGVMLGIYGPAYTANLAFACELYLKQLLTLDNKDVRGHKLLELYGNLNEEYRKDIEKEYISRCNEFLRERDVEMRSLEKCLADYNSAFEDWRYWYEGGKESKVMGWYDFHIFIEILRDQIHLLQNEEVNV